MTSKTHLIRTTLTYSISQNRRAPEAVSLSYQVSSFELLEQRLAMLYDSNLSAVSRRSLLTDTTEMSKTPPHTARTFPVTF